MVVSLGADAGLELNIPPSVCVAYAPLYVSSRPSDREGVSLFLGGPQLEASAYRADMPVTVQLEDLVRRAGAVMVNRAGQTVPAHYGSAPGELAVCLRRVGLAVRPDLGTVLIEGPLVALEQFVELWLGHGLAVGGVAKHGGGWCCRSLKGRRLTLVFSRDQGAGFVSHVGRKLAPFGSIELRDTSEQTVILGLVGRMANALLAALRMEPPSVDRWTISPFFEMDLGDTRFDVLSAPSTEVLLIVDRSGAVNLWRRLEREGRPFGISCVGIDSIVRYELLRRA